MKGVGAHAEADQLGVDPCAAPLRVLVFLEHDDAGAFTEDKAVAVLRLVESMEEDDDVQQVYANFDIPSNVLERVSAQV